MINARSESADRKPAFREAFPRRRCLLPADGFYEWKRPETGRGPKTPYWIHPANGVLITFAGLWERWRAPDGELLHTFAILTTRANEWMVRLHDRMPVVIAPEDREPWMDPDTALGEVRRLLKPPPEELFTARAVSTYVNRPENEGPECIEPAPDLSSP